MTLKDIIQEARTKYGEASSIILTANEPTGQAPMELFITDEHTENYLSLKNSADTDRGLITGLMALGAVPCLLMAIWFFSTGKTEGGINGLLVGLPMLLIPFLWEILRPLPLPVLFNRRTKEIYFDNNGELFHSPWSVAQAVACEFQIIGPYTAGINNASLEVVVQQFDKPQNILMVSLGSPTGKTLDMQKGFWEYIRSYMNNGPWFDKTGAHSQSDAFVKSQLEANLKQSDFLKHTRQTIAKKKSTSAGKNYLSGIDFVMILANLFFYPSSRIQDFTYNIAKRRSRNRWPKIVLERLQSDGPSTKLTDIEKMARLAIHH
ncbi:MULTISPECIES: hypothetical protein [unclassified Pseudomonas]|uniref:hypothetical protein n=1 Tax=unclassified Pseudomonas TaxID=196821 RepID=UPI001CBDDD86|nr:MULTISPECIES: hypothetical protein [unclassified Pseudomonas]